MIINRIYEHQNLLSLWFASFLVGLRTYQHPCTWTSFYPEYWGRKYLRNISYFSTRLHGVTSHKQLTLCWCGLVFFCALLRIVLINTAFWNLFRFSASLLISVLQHIPLSIKLTLFLCLINSTPWKGIGLWVSSCKLHPLWTNASILEVCLLSTVRLDAAERTWNSALACN